MRIPHLLAPALPAVAVLVMASGGMARAMAGPEPLQREIHIASGEEAREDLVAIGGHISVDGIARKTVAAIGGSLELNGTADGDVVGVGADVRLGPHAVVRGDLVCIGPKPLRAEGSRVMGEFVYIKTSEELGDWLIKAVSFDPLKQSWSPLVVGIRIIMLFTWFLIAAAVVLAFPVQIRHTASEIPAHFGRFAVVGFIWFLALIVMVVLLALLCLVLVGIPLLLLLSVFAVLIKVFGNVSIYYFCGTRILNALRWDANSDVLAVLAGLSLLGLVQFLPVIGWLIWTILGIIGMGATLATKFGTGQPWFSPKPLAVTSGPDL